MRASRPVRIAGRTPRWPIVGSDFHSVERKVLGQSTASPSRQPRSDRRIYKSDRYVPRGSRTFPRACGDSWPLRGGAADALPESPRGARCWFGTAGPPSHRTARTTASIKPLSRLGLRKNTTRDRALTLSTGVHLPCIRRGTPGRPNPQIDEPQDLEVRPWARTRRKGMPMSQFRVLKCLNSAEPGHVGRTFWPEWCGPDASRSQPDVGRDRHLE
jgi:hypothetical protein